MARIFISHSSPDRASAGEIMEWLQSLGFDNAFLDIDERTGIRPGEKWEARLYEELAACSAVVLVVTPDWLASKWCFAEFVQARATGKAIFPVILTADGGQTFAEDLQRVDFTTDREGGKRRLAQRLKELALDVQSGFEWDRKRAPYPGLPAFEAEDAAVYFGRDTEVRELVDRLRARRALGGAHIVAVLGASGSGKSSLVRAGVLPRLAKFEPGFVVVPPLRPGTDPCTALAKALADRLGQPLQWRTLHDDLSADAAAVATDLLMAAGRREATLLITIDQAEELFTTTPTDVRALFAQWLRALQRQSVLLLLTLRSDRLGELQRWAQDVGGFDQFSLPPLLPARLAQVIEGPARVAGVAISPGVTDAVMHDAGGPDAMPLLAFTLRELWAHATADATTDAPAIRLADYRLLGDAQAGLNPLENAVRRRADELVAPLDEAARKTLREAFVGALVRIDDQGRYGRCAARWDGFDPAVHALLDSFVAARLLVLRSDEAGQRSVEVAHEALLRKWPLLRNWLDDERGFLIGRLQLQRALDDWAAAAPAERDAALLQGLMLQRAQVWLVERARSLSLPQREFIATSVARERGLRSAARRRWIAIGSVGVIALGVIVALGVYLREQRIDAAALAVEVEADRWLQRASAALAYGQTDRALAQATHAYGLLPGAKTRSAVWQASMALPSQWRLSVPAVAADGELPPSSIGAVSALAWSADAKRLLVGDRAGALHQLPLDGQRLVATLGTPRQRAPSKDQPEAVLALRELDDGSALALLEDGRVLRRAPGAEVFALQAQLEPLAAAHIGADGRGVLVLTQAERRALWLDCSAGCSARPLFPALGEVGALALAAREAIAAAAVGDSQLLLGRVGAAPRRITLALPEQARIVALALDAPGEHLAVSASHGEAFVLDAAGRVLATLPGFGADARRLAWAPDGQTLATDCEAASLCIWRSRRDSQRQGGGGGTTEALALDTVLAVQGLAAGALAWSGDGRLLAGGDIEGRVHVWDVAAQAGAATALHAADARPLADIDVDPQGQRIAAADVHGRAVLWDVATRSVLRTFEHSVAAETIALRWHPRQPLLALATLGGGAEVFGLEGGKPTLRIDGAIESLAWDAADERLISGGEDGVVRSHRLGAPDATSGQPLASPHGDAVIALAVAPAPGMATAVYSADASGVIKRGGDAPAAASGNGPAGSDKAAAAGGAGAGAGATDAGTVATAVDVAGKAFSVGALDVAADGKHWLAAGSAGDVLVFDRATNQLLQRLETGADQVHDAAFSADGRFIAAIDNAGRLQLWQAPRWQRHATLWLRHEPGRGGSDVLGRLGALRRLAWLPDSHRIAVATQSGAAVVIPLPDTATAPP